MDFSNKDFSDDSLMVQNDESIVDPITASTGPALTSAGAEQSPYATMASRNNNDINDALAQQQGSFKVNQIAQDGDARASGSNEEQGGLDLMSGERPALYGTYADDLAREIINETISPIKQATPKETNKNYSDDLLNEGAQSQGELHKTATDLADFELPPYSASSSVSGAKQSPPKDQSAPPTSSQNASRDPPSLSELRDLLLSNYSRVSHIFHWKKPIESGVFFTIGLTLIVALTFFSIISVFAYSALGLMLASGSIRLYKTLMATLNRSTETPVDYIWIEVQSLNVSMSLDRMHELVDSSLGSLNAFLTYFKQVLLVEDKVATLKFGAFIYSLTYIGAWFNGMTLITIAYLALFSVPILYEKNQTKIDGFLNQATKQIHATTSMVTNRVTSIVSGSSSESAKKKN